MSRPVRTVGRVITVTLPEEIGDIDGSDPATDETKAELAGKTLIFPRGLTVAELHDRLIARLKDDYDVAHVDLELADDGSVEYLAIGGRAAGLGPTLPPRTVAGDVATLALDQADAAELDDDTRYRLLTLPATPSAEQEFAGLLRAADETMEAVTVAPDSDLVGTTVGAIDATVVAVRPDGQQVEALPDRTRTLSAGDVVYVVARPETLRRVAAAAGGSGTTAPLRADGAEST